MNEQVSALGVDDVLLQWRASVSGEPLPTDDVRNALIAKGARVEAVERRYNNRSDSPIERYLSVTYNNLTLAVHYADASQVTVRPPAGLIWFNLINKMIVTSR